MYVGIDDLYDFFSRGFYKGINAIDKANNFSDKIVEPIIGILYLISFIVFLFGYFKNKIS